MLGVYDTVHNNPHDKSLFYLLCILLFPKNLWKPLYILLKFDISPFSMHDSLNLATINSWESESEYFIEYSYWL